MTPARGGFFSLRDEDKYIINEIELSATPRVVETSANEHAIVFGQQLLVIYWGQGQDVLAPIWFRFSGFFLILIVSFYAPMRDANGEEVPPSYNR